IVQVGIAAQLPSGVHSATNLDYQAFIDFLLQGLDAYEPIPKARFNTDKIRGDAVGHVITDTGAFLKGIAAFDHVEFGISVKDARMMTVSTRKLIETAFLSLYDSGIDYRSQNVGCYMSGVAHDAFALSGHDDTDATKSLSYPPAMIANKVSYHLDLRGPSVPVDTACSSTMYATHLAVQALRQNDCDAALVGGSQINHRRHRFTEWLSYSSGRIISPDGRCKPFDASADGFGRGEGVVVVVLKRLSDALRDGDHIYANILGTGVNASGSLAPVNAPAPAAQVDAMQRAFRQAQRSPQDVDFVELHATGTAVGDPAEANWVGEHFHRDSDLLVGSVKGNLGHLEIAAFLASLCKVCGIFERGLIPPNVHLKRPNPAIRWSEWKLRVPLDPEPLGCRSSTGRSLIALSSSGIGGANGHCVVEAPPARDDDAPSFWQREIMAPAPTLLVVGGLTPRSAAAAAERALDTVLDASNDLQSLARTLARRARSMTWRSFALLDSEHNARFTEPSIAPKTAPRLVYIFSGQGGQHMQMGRVLFKCCTIFRSSILALDELYAAATGKSLIATTGLFGDAPTSPTTQLSDVWPIAVLLPALAMLQIALVDTLATIGIRPDVVLGHSAGETAMLVACGSASRGMALDLAIARGRALSLLEGAGGAMAALGCSQDDAQEIIKSVTAELGPGILEIGCYNSASAVTLSGVSTHVTAAVEKAIARGFFARALRTRVAVHSSMVAACKAEFSRLVGNVFSRNVVEPPGVETYSSKTGRLFSGSPDASYFWEATLGKVRFTEAISSVCQKYPSATFLEIGPHPALVGYIMSMTENNLVTCPLRRLAVESVEAELRNFLTTIGKLVIAGHHSIDFDLLYGTRQRFRGVLPSYPFAPKDIPWLIPSPEIQRQQQHRDGPLNYPQLQVNQYTHPGLADHVIKGEPIMPAAGFIEMALEFGATALFDVEFHSLLSLSSERPTPIDVKLEGSHWSVNDCRHSVLTDIHPIQYDRRHASGFLSKESPKGMLNAPLDLDSIRQGMTPLPGDFYRTLPPFTQYGPMYRRIVQAYFKIGVHGAVDALTELEACGEDIPNFSDYRFHPAILDAALHVLVHPYITGNYDHDSYHLPSRISSLRLSPAFFANPFPRRLYSHASFIEWTPDALSYNLTITDSSGVVFCLIDRLEVALHGVREKHIERRFEAVYRRLDCPLVHRDCSAQAQASQADDNEVTQLSCNGGPLPAPTSTDAPTAVRYVRGEEMLLQRIVASFDPFKPLSLLIVADSSSSDAMFGFTRSLRKEYPAWVIQAAAFGESWTALQIAAAVPHILRIATDEPELLVDDAGALHVLRIEAAAPPSRHLPFSVGLPWKYENGEVTQTFAPKAPSSDHVVVEVESVSCVPGNMWFYTGTIQDPPSTVVGIAHGPVSTHVVSHRGALARRDEDSFEVQVCGALQGPALLAPTIIALAVTPWKLADPQRLRGRTVLVAEEDRMLGRQICSTCADVGLEASLVSQSDDDGQLLSSHARRPTYIIARNRDRFSSLWSRLDVPSGHLLVWDHPRKGIQFFASHDPWVLGDALRMAMRIASGQYGTVSYLPPAQMLCPMPSKALRARELFDPHRPYLLVGGIGSLGLHIALWMYEHGARELVLTSRSGPQSLCDRGDFISQRILQYLQARGDLVLHSVAVDATSEHDMKALSCAVNKKFAGCFLLSAVLLDSLFTAHTQETFERAFPSKVQAFRVLEKTIDLHSLDFIVTFSSVSGMFGNPGQTSYAAANTELAGLTRKYSNALSLVSPIIYDSRILTLSDGTYKSQVQHMTSWGMSARAELCDFIGDGIIKLHDGPIWQYIPDLNWRGVREHMGPSRLYDHLSPVESQVPRMTFRNEAPSVLHTVCHILDLDPEEVSLDVPLTAYGLDSLGATGLSSALRPLLSISQIQLLADITIRDIQSRVDRVPPLLPSAEKHVPRHLHPSWMSADGNERIHAMHDLVERLTADMYPCPWNSSPCHPHGEELRPQLVLVTGTTGSVGAHFLARLLNKQERSKVVALIRRGAGDISPVERQKATFLSRGLDVSLLASNRLRVVSADLEQANLGLPSDLYEEIRMHLTHVVHLGWPVNFNMPLDSFKGAMLGLHGLIGLANSARKRGLVTILYASSSAVFKNYAAATLPAEAPVPAWMAAGQGYSESKWAAERVLEIASERAIVKAVIVRIGQLTGGINGSWNTKEWLPALVSASAVLGCLPLGDGVVSWIPVDRAAEIIINLLRPLPPYVIVHLRHPQPLPWNTMMGYFSKALQLPLLSYPVWLQKLVAEGPSTTDARGTKSKLLHPALALLDHFRAIAHAELRTNGYNLARENNGLSVLMGIEESRRLSVELGSMSQLSPSDVEKWVGYWRSVGAIVI
ncbi:ketoacyl-synt-domain-containing protein, partial [Trametes cingulata]